MQAILLEFDRLRRMSLGGPMSDARSDRHARLNRYCNVLPYDANRVRLQGGSSDYINASLLASPPDEQPNWQYIATQVSSLHALLITRISKLLRSRVPCQSLRRAAVWLASA